MWASSLGTVNCYLFSIAASMAPNMPVCTLKNIFNTQKGRFEARGNTFVSKGKVQKKIEEKKLTSVSFMYVCVAENGEMLVFFFFFFPQQ